MKNWTNWNWRHDPHAPLGWTDTEQRVVLVEGMAAAEMDGMGIVGDSPLALTERAIGKSAGWGTDRSAIFIYAERPAALAWWAEHRPAFNARAIPALLVERQADLDVGLQTLVRMPAAYRALVLSPRESINIGLGGTMPKAWEVGYHGVYNFVHQVIVRGAEGDDAEPMHPAWVRAVRDECRGLAAFAFTSWGEWRPSASAAFWRDGGTRSEEERGAAMLSDGRVVLEQEPAEAVRARDRAAGYHVHAPVIERDRSALACLHAAWNRESPAAPAPPPYDELAWFHRVGVERSGRVLHERGWRRETEHLELPEELR